MTRATWELHDRPQWRVPRNSPQGKESEAYPASPDRIEASLPGPPPAQRHHGPPRVPRRPRARDRPVSTASRRQSRQRRQRSPQTLLRGAVGPDQSEQSRNAHIPPTLVQKLSLIHISEPTRQAEISYAVFCLKKKKKQQTQ